MKRFFTVLFTTLLLSAVLCVSASASDFDKAAENLSAIGMLRGTAAGGFELDRAPTRSEAAIMLVRLYGAEESSKTAYSAGEISHPFTDVSEFASPYVAWLYTNGIANGVSETTFGSQRACTVQNYATFLLRALGYKDGKDFQYADALTFAQSKGFYDPITFSGTFLRDDLAGLTYQALAADMADGKTYLLDTLVKSGAIDAKAAAPMTEVIENYRAMQNATASMEQESFDIDLDMKMDMTMSADGETVHTPTTSSGNMKLITKADDIQMAYSIATVAEGLNMDMSYWVKDGWVYMAVDTGEESMKFKSKVDGFEELKDQLQFADVTSMNVSGLAMIDSLTLKKSGSNTVYTMVINENMGGILDNLSDLLGDTAGMKFGAITAEYTVNSRGEVKNTTMNFSADMTMELPMEDGINTVSMDLHYDYDMSMKIKATGSAVKITYPDFSDFAEISSAEMDTLA